MQLLTKTQAVSLGMKVIFQRASSVTVFLNILSDMYQADQHLCVCVWI